MPKQCVFKYKIHNFPEFLIIFFALKLRGPQNHLLLLRSQPPDDGVARDYWRSDCHGHCLAVGGQGRGHLRDYLLLGGALGRIVDNVQEIRNKKNQAFFPKLSWKPCLDWTAA